VSETGYLFRVDAGRVWGVSLGHFQACLLLKQNLPPTSNCVFLMRDYPDGIDLALKHALRVKKITNPEAEESQLMKLVDELRPKWLICNLPCCDYQQVFDYCRARGIKSLVIDGIGACKSKPDFIINDSLSPAADLYPQVDASTKVFWGPDWFLTPSLPLGPEPNSTASKVMITFGGSDPAGLTVKTVEALKDLQAPVRFLVVLGPAFPDSTPAALRELPAHFRIVRNPGNFLGLMANQDLVICAGGRTLFEAAGSGRPCILIPSIEHELLSAQSFSAQTGFLNLGLWDLDHSPQLLRSSLMELLDDPVKRLSMYERGKTLIDGNGLKLMLELLT
jgi:spore coat polysaccharide biosynthesis predicted glycosyltransferase SpsG